jgi:predicted amino acid racemase
MFLDATLRRNKNIMEAAFELHQQGLIEPDTYVLDMDSIIYNAESMKKEADKYGIGLYFMTKQFGRNPIISRELMKLGFDGAVAVDFREAETLSQSGIKLGHVGHLVQLPKNMIRDILLKRPEIITVFSIEKAREISFEASKLNITQNIMLRIIDEGDILYPGQYGGIYLKELVETAREIAALPNLNIQGVTSFPCFLYDSESKSIEKTRNMDTLVKAKTLLKDKLNIEIKQVNAPSATCTSSIKSIAACGGTQGEPGHGLMGTTPLHAACDEVEIPAVVYVSEVSHNLGKSAYCYGGGHYRRSHMENALVGKNLATAERYKVSEVPVENIDYYFELNDGAAVGDTAVFAFRTQIFVTRSNVAVVKGIHEGCPEIVGIYDNLGRLIRR